MQTLVGKVFMIFLLFFLFFFPRTFSGEFPHLVLITRGCGGSQMCTGSLVSNKAVVTVGHCCDG